MSHMSVDVNSLTKLVDSNDTAKEKHAISKQGLFKKCRVVQYLEIYEHNPGYQYTKEELCDSINNAYKNI